MELKIPNVISDTDRYGTVRYYYRTKGKPKIRLVSPPGSPAFFDEIARAAQQKPASRRAEPVKRVVVGSFRDLLNRYYAYSGFAKLDPETQLWIRRALEYVAKGREDLPVALAKRKNLQDIIEGRSATPSMANKIQRSLRRVFRYAVEIEMIDSDPTTALKTIKYKTNGHPPWTPDDIAAYERTHIDVGSNQRLALALFRYIGCRLEDVVRLGPQNINNGRLRYTMAKNEHRNPIDVEIPVLPELAKALASAKRVGIKHFLVKSTGKPYSVRGFASVFERWCKQAGVKKSSHGFRKTIGATLADNGATPHEIMSWLGHRTLTEAQRYSLTANRSKLADSAASKMK